MTKNWNIRSSYSDEKNIVDILLQNRNINTQEDKELFLNPPSISELLKRLPREFLESLSLAKKQIQHAISQDTPILIYGDYDADGICATAILYSTITKELGYTKCAYFIPNRFDHGYGLSLGSIADVEKLLGEKFNAKSALLITVDTGITAVAEVAHLKSQGFQVIVTDHHQRPSELPQADCIVWCDQMVGSGISWVLSKVLGSKDPQLLSLACIATITDLQPLTGINRVLVRDGLEILNTNPLLGLRKLFEVSGTKLGDLSTYQLGWVVGPRLNATGRLLDASAAVELLLESNESKALELAHKLNSINLDRQNKTLEMYDLAYNNEDADLPSVIVTSHKDFHEGIIGLVASKLVQKYYRPSVVISITDGHGKGSVRSISGINIIEALRKFEHLFESLGGHPMAAGFSIKTENIEQLKNSLNTLISTTYPAEVFVPSLEIDCSIPLDVLSLDFFSEVDSLRPYGVGNPEPLFACLQVGVAGFDLVGKENNHLSLSLYDNGITQKAIYFDGKDLAANLSMGSRVDIAYTLSKNVFNGREKLNIIVKDMRIC